MKIQIKIACLNYTGKRMRGKASTKSLDGHFPRVGVDPDIDSRDLGSQRNENIVNDFDEDVLQGDVVFDHGLK